MNTLLAVDGSEAALHAVRGLIEHVRSYRDKPHVHLLYVHPRVPIGLVTHPLSHDTLETYYREEGDAALMVAQRLLLDAELPFTSHINVGAPAETIVQKALELDCDLICMGSHGQGALQNAILGSVAAKVLHHARMPVLLIK